MTIPAVSPLCVILLIITIVKASYYQNTDYCSLCQEHTMCKYYNLGYKCGYTSTGGYLTEDEKKTIVDTHNRLRSLVASGQERRGNPGPQPPASDMQLLTWDEDLAKVAQAWADQCDFGHDKCRLDPRFDVGQNVFLSEGGVPWDQAIISWYSEVEYFDKNLVDNFIFDEVTGHYTQMLWGNTRYIGCGKRTYPQKPRRYRRDIEKLPELNITKIMEIKEQLNSMTNRQKRDVMDQLSPVFHINDTDVENKSRQARRIDYYNNHQFNYRHYQPSYDSEMEKFRQEIAAYNRSIHEYFQKYQKELSQAGDYKKQIKFYQDYLKKLEQISNGGDAYDFQSLLQQYEIFKQVHERQQYHDQKLKQKLANQKKLNPVISKYYSFSPSKPVIAGIEYEYYVCNYGPSGNYPDSRMYTQGYSRCNYYGLCQDPLTEAYYPSVDRASDPILSLIHTQFK